MLLAFLLLTNRFKVPHVWGNDVESYIAIAAAAPQFPERAVGSAYAGRWVPHWAVGALQGLTGLSLHATYWTVALGLVVGLLVVACAVFASADLSPGLGPIGVAAFALAPYASIRATLTAPGLLQDLVFVLGLAVCLVGLLRVSPALVLGGIVLALCGRQTMLLVLPVAAVWILIEPAWSASTRRRWWAAAVVGVGAAAYAAILAVAAGFDFPFGPDGLGDTVVLDPPGLRAAASHLGRTAIPFVALGAVLAAVAFVLARGRVRVGDVPRRVWLALAMWAAIVVQPLLISPDFPGFAFNEQRLAGLGLLPFVLAVVLALDVAVTRGLLGVRRTGSAIAAGVLAIASLSHIFTWIGPSNLAQFLALQLAAAAVLFGLVVVAAGGRPRLSAA